MIQDHKKSAKNHVRNKVRHYVRKHKANMIFKPTKGHELDDYKKKVQSIPKWKHSMGGKNYTTAEARVGVDAARVPGFRTEASCSCRRLAPRLTSPSPPIPVTMDTTCVIFAGRGGTCQSRKLEGWL